MMELKEHPFVTSLEKLREAKDRAALARLRRGLGKRMGTPEMFPYVVPYLPNSPREQEHYFVVAALFAMHPAESPRGVSLGGAFRRIWEESDWSESIEKRFMNLLSTDADDIAEHLRHVVSLARSRNVPIEYHRLLYDLKYWDHPGRRVQFAWARDFWGTPKDSGNEDPKKGAES